MKDLDWIWIKIGAWTLVVVLVICGLVVAGVCGTQQILISNKYPQTRFTIVDKQAEISTVFYTVKDNETGVYYITTSYGGVSPLYNEDGTLYVGETA